VVVSSSHSSRPSPPDGGRLLAVGDKTGVTLVEIDAANGHSTDRP
jgi:hypothetical protein